MADILEHLRRLLRLYESSVDNALSFIIFLSSKGDDSMKYTPSLLVLFSLILAMALALGSLGAASAAAVPNCTQYYTVERGDTLAKIAARYNTTWRILAELNNIKDANLIYTGQRICVSVSASTTPATPRPTTTPAPVPSFSIVSVNVDQSVTIRTANFPANLTFNVLWGDFGTRAVNGLRSGTITSGSGGAFTATINIPSQMHGKDRVAIRLESTSTAHFSYNWFHNKTTASTTPTPTPAPGQTTTIPTFSISSVNRDQSVTIRTANFPAGKNFNVTMGAMGTRGIGGVSVGTLDSGTGGALTATFTIPASLAGSSRIAIRLESSASGHFSYNWFYNNTTP
jgi:hypothetical protein